MKVVGIVVGRMGSSRLWGKVMLPLAGRPAMWHCYQRIKACYPVSEVWFMPTDDPADEEIRLLAESLGEPYVIRPNRGIDVAAGLLQVHDAADADVYISCSCDSPVSENIYVRKVIDAYLAGAKYVHFDDPDMIWLAVTSLCVTGRWQMEQHRRIDNFFLHEHPGGMMSTEPQRLATLNPHDIAIVAPEDGERQWKRDYRLQVDEPRDAYVMATLYATLYINDHQPICTTQAIQWADQHPEVLRYNAPVIESAANLSSYTMYEKARPTLDRVLHAVRASKDCRNKLQYCDRCGEYLGYVREETENHWFYTTQGIRLGPKGKVPCVCGAVRKWYGERA